jgi:hypothetical protein
MFLLGKCWAKCLNACNVLSMFPPKSRYPRPQCKEETDVSNPTLLSKRNEARTVTISPFGPCFSPFGPCFWPSSFFFSHQVHALLKVTLQENNKNIAYQDSATNTTVARHYLKNYSAGVLLRLTPRFAHISSSDPSTAKSSL